MAIAETYLLYLFVVYVGLMGLLTAYAHVLPAHPDLRLDRMVDQSV